MNTNILNFPTICAPHTLELDTPLTFFSENEIHPNPGEHYFKVIIGLDGETIQTLNITAHIRELKTRVGESDRLTDFVNTRF